jgi:hypothetical protein
VFARRAKPGAELLVAEAPQALGRVPTRVASVEPEPELETPPLTLGGLLAQSLKSSAYYSTPQSRRQVASLGWERGMNQTVWDEDVDETARETSDAADDTAATVASDSAADDEATAASDVVAIAVPAPQPAVRPAASEKTKSKVEKVVASNEPAPKKRRAERRQKKEKVASDSRRSRKARNEQRPSRTAKVARRYERERVADYSERRESWGGDRGRNTQQLTTMGLRAQSSSTL